MGTPDNKLPQDVAVAPSSVVAGSWGTLVVSYRIGPGGAEPGFRLRVQLPNSWHAWFRNSAKGVQASDPWAPNFVKAQAAREGSVVSCTVLDGTTEPYVKTTRLGLDGRRSRYAYVVEVEVRRGRLEPGDVVEVVYGDRSQGSPGFVAALHPEGNERLAVAYAHAGDSDFTSLPAERCPVLAVVPDAPVEMQVTVPSSVRVGEPSAMSVVLMDWLGNAVPVQEGMLEFKVLSGEASCQPEVVASGSGDVVMTVPFVPTAAGIVRFLVTYRNHNTAMSAVSNPARSQGEGFSDSVYWGDLHSHGDASFDGVGTHAFEYARDVAHLDFYALTDHVEVWPVARWEELRAEVVKHYRAGAFVTLLAYEGTFGPPWGHHNVYFRGTDGIALGSSAGTLLDLWDHLRHGDALTIPHHTGVAFSTRNEGHLPGGASPNPDWKYHDANLRPLIEIYSGHGLCETFDPGHPLSYENSDFSINTSVQGPHYATDAWLQGLQLGVVCSSDNHRGQPGRSELGLTAVFASELTREQIFDSLRDRRCYGTTGQRILMAFDVEGVPMGGRVVKSGALTMNIEVHGTGDIEWVELVGVDQEAGTVTCRRRWVPRALDFATRWVEHAPIRRGNYYVRLRQTEDYRRRPVMAWSSPVWVGGE